VLGCHSQMVRPFRSEVEAMANTPKLENTYDDHPFLWEVNVTGPDLILRIGW